MLAIFSGSYDPDLELIGRSAKSLEVTAADQRYAHLSASVGDEMIRRLDRSPEPPEGDQ